MKRWLLLIGYVLLCGSLSAQSFEVSGLQDAYKGTIGDLIKAPLRIKNKSEKPITLVIRRVDTQIGTTQKNLFCPDNNCADQRSEEYIFKIEPGQTLQNFSIGLEAGLAEGFSTVRYLIFNKSNPSESSSIELNYVVEGRSEKSNIYSSKYITIHDVYPNPVIDYANIDYKLHSDEVKTKIVIHNILGNTLTEYELPYLETSIKIPAEQLGAGIYFYTLYIENEGVMTRKLIVKK
jgi:hypothetical protein